MESIQAEKAVCGPDFNSITSGNETTLAGISVIQPT